MPRRRLHHLYKGMHFQQLRSFCETARLGSMAAAASSLGVSQPTIWAQVHALEREFGTPLVETHRRGCRLTEAGHLLAELASPLVNGFESLKRAFHERHGDQVASLTVAASQRILIEDLPEPIAVFEQEHPHVRLILLERMSGHVAEAVAAGEADLGLSTEAEAGDLGPHLVFEPAYDLDILLITPSDHPLVRRSRLSLRDLRGFPLVNAVTGFPRPDIARTLEQLGVFRAQGRRIEAVNTPVIRRYVEMGFGVGIVVGRPDQVGSRQLHERSLRRHFGHATVSLIWRKGVVPPVHARTFADTVQTVLGLRPAT